MKKYKVTYYRTLVREVVIEAETLDQAKQQALNEVSSVDHADFDEISEECGEIEGDELLIPDTFWIIC